MTDSVGPWWEKCKELLVVPVPSGLLVLTRRTLQADDPQAALLKLAAIAASRPRWDDTVALWLDHGPQTMSGPVREYLRSKVTTGLVRKDQLVAVPWPWPGVHDTRDAPAANLPTNALEHLADFYGVPVHISPEPTGPPRNAAVDDNRLQTSREATAPGGQKPSPQHPDQYLHQYLDQLDKVRAQLRDPGPNSDGSVRTFSESDHPALWWVRETNDDASESAANLAPRTNDSRIAAPQDPAAGVATADPAGRVVTADMLPTPIPNKPPAHPDLAATPGIEAVEPIHAGLYLPGLGGGEQARYAAQKLPRFDGYTTIAASLDPAAGKVVTPTGSYSPQRFNDLLTRHGVAPDARLILVICEAAGAADPSQRFAEGLFAVRNAELLAGNAVAWASPHDDDVLLGELSIDPNGVPRIHARGDLLSFMPGQAEPARLGPRLRAAMASLGAAGTRSPTSSRQTELVIDCCAARFVRPHPAGPARGARAEPRSADRYRSIAARLPQHR